MDNRIFNVNGCGLDNLREVLRLVFQQSGFKKAVGYLVDSKKGLILLWSQAPGWTKFPAPVGFETAAVVVWDWLQESPAIELSGRDNPYDDSDVSNEPGWRVYSEVTWPVTRMQFAVSHRLGCGTANSLFSNRLEVMCCAFQLWVRTDVLPCMQSNGKRRSSALIGNNPSDRMVISS